MVMAENTSRWDVAWGPDFKVGIDRARDILEKGEARFRRNGRLDLRFRLSRFVAHYFPDANG